MQANVGDSTSPHPTELTPASGQPPSHSAAGEARTEVAHGSPTPFNDEDAQIGQSALRRKTGRREVSKDPFASEDSDSDDPFLIWDVDYGDPEGYGGVQFRTDVSLAGIHMMIVMSDRTNLFYPILQITAEKFAMLVENKEQTMWGATDVSLAVSYYNNRLDAWEPFLERTLLRLSMVQDQTRSHLYIGFPQPVSLNFSEELIETVVPAYLELERTKKEEAAS